MKRKIFTVLQLNQYIKGLLEEDVILNDIFVEGEISNFKHHTSGHMYFTLKDSSASVNCVLFKDRSYDLNFLPENGMKVISLGRVSLYEKTGNYQIYVDMLEPAGMGALYLSFMQLKEKLSEKGYFDKEHKKKIPSYPKKVALITSPTGAAIRDIIQISKRRNKNVELVVVPTLVQGENAPKSIAESIKLVDNWGKADVIILGRGGGSIEDLWAFNEEIVANAVFKCKTPIISAVGHETDYTICDFVADFRAPTPSVAAEIAIHDLSLLVENINSLTYSLGYLLSNNLEIKYQKLERLINSKALKSPKTNVYERQIYLENLLKDINKEMTSKIELSHKNLGNNLAMLQNLSPLNVLNRGYAIINDTKGNIANSIENIQVNDTININLKDGKISANVIEKHSISIK